jgi:hypothetical protein
MQYEVVLVARTYPIRVAGNSGPMSHEISWVNLAYDVNRQLVAAGRPPLVSMDALQQFADACQIAYKSGKYPVPEGRAADPALWDQDDREQYREAASEIHRDALRLLSVDTVTELRKLFELTTVTKKLRRVAEFSEEDLRVSCRINRPAHIVITFMNYLLPTLWGTTDRKQLMAEENRGALQYLAKFIDRVTKATNTPVRYVSFGPQDENMIDVSPANGVELGAEFEDGA